MSRKKKRTRYKAKEIKASNKPARQPQDKWIKPQKNLEDNLYVAVWKEVDGAVLDAFKSHPEYISPKVKRKTVRTSIVKRVVGAIFSFTDKQKEKYKSFATEQRVEDSVPGCKD